MGGGSQSNSIFVQNFSILILTTSQYYLNIRRENIENMDERYQVMAGGRRVAEVLVDTVNKFVYHQNGVIGGVTR